MEAPVFPAYSWLDFFFTVTGVCTFLFDVGSDLWLACEFYLRGDALWFGLLLGFMFTASVIVQIFSWFWFKYDRELENFDSSVILLGSSRYVKLMFLLHFCQLGFFLRQLSAIWLGFRVWWRGEERSDYAIYLTHDLSMLRLIETFCESTPQLALMMYVMLHCNHARTVQYVGMAASTVSIAWMLVDYHCSLRSFLPEKSKQTLLSSTVYFLWNLLLIGPRVVTVALFASILPYYVTAHFLCLWVAFVIWAYLQNTSFMESTVGEWLYRAIVGLIWYFSWFNVTEGKTRGRSIIYHIFITTDSGILLLTWWWLRDPEVTKPYAVILLILLPLTSMVGLFVKVLYYYYLHPNLLKEQDLAKALSDVPDAGKLLKVTLESDSGFSATAVNKRMGKHVANFYSTRTFSVVETKRHKINGTLWG